MIHEHSENSDSMASFERKPAYQMTVLGSATTCLLLFFFYYFSIESSFQKPGIYKPNLKEVYAVQDVTQGAVITEILPGLRIQIPAKKVRKADGRTVCYKAIR